MPAGAGYASPRTDGLAIASLIIGIFSLLCFFICLGVILGPTAAIMGYISRQKVLGSGGAVGGGTLALVGMILGILGFLASAGWIIFIATSSRTSTP